MSQVRVSFLGTGSGLCIHRAHTAIVLDCPGGTRLLLDAGSGNAAMRHGAALGLMPEEFGPVFLTHHHSDHIDGLPFLEFWRTMVKPGGPPLHVYGTEETLEGVRQLCRVARRALKVDQDGAVTDDGHAVLRWHPTEAGQRVALDGATLAFPFPADHISGAVGWRIEAGGVSVVFSGDTRFSPHLVEAAQGARLLIHEVFSTEADKERTHQHGHSTAADAGRAAAQAGVAELVITHIDTAFHFNPQPLVAEARRYFDGPISVASDLYQTSVGAG
jgi:ribonuclease Z